MIIAYTGKTGSGKTFQMVKDVYPLWKKGNDIYSNTYLKFENKKFKQGTNIIKNPENFTILEKLSEIIRRNWLIHARKFIIQYFIPWKINEKHYIPKHRGTIYYFEDITELLEVRNGIILMDEGQALLEARNWENLPMEFSNKLRQHRKHLLHLYITTQNLGTIDINARRLVQKWFHCKDIFALFWKRNPSLLSIHVKLKKDIDMLYNNVDDLLVDNLSWRIFIIHLFSKKIYDTLYDIGFTTLKSVWIQQNEQTKLLIMPKKWTLQNARTQQLLLKFYLNPNKSIYSRKD